MIEQATGDVVRDEGQVVMACDLSAGMVIIFALDTADGPARVPVRLTKVIRHPAYGDFLRVRGTIADHPAMDPMRINKTIGLSERVSISPGNQ